MASKGSYGEKGAHNMGKQHRGKAMHIKPAAGHDLMAHPSHHQANMDHGSPRGFHPPVEQLDGSGFEPHMGDNEAACD